MNQHNDRVKPHLGRDGSSIGELGVVDERGPGVGREVSGGGVAKRLDQSRLPASVLTHDHRQWLEEFHLHGIVGTHASDSLRRRR